jgi:hypothetical protein
VAGRDSLDLELVIERSGNPLHLLCGCYDEMKAAGDSLGGRLFGDVGEERLNAGAGCAH